MKKSSFGRILLHMIITLVAAAVYFYVVLPPINLRSSEFWMFLIYALIFFGVLESFAAIRRIFSETKIVSHKATANEAKKSFRLLNSTSKVAFAAAALCFVFLVVVSFLATEFFNPGAYSSLITITEGDFATVPGVISNSNASFRTDGIASPGFKYCLITFSFTCSIICS